MAIKAWLEKLTPSSQHKVNLSVVILNEGIYVSHIEHDEVQACQFYRAENQDWQSALVQAMAAPLPNHPVCRVTLGAHFYQTYQIDKPELPAEEWSVALPFLLKDMLTERVTDIIADGVLLPNNNKLQAYVLSKSVLAQIQAVLQSKGVQLESLLPEDQVWAQIDTDAAEFMLLHQNGESGFKIGGFVEQLPMFQRTIRGIMSPMTGEMANSFQLDSLALELQRSIDYLASQLRQAGLNYLYLCCDGEQAVELQHELQQRLNVKVQLLSESQQSCGDSLALIAARMVPSGVDLYPLHLRPQKQWLTLGNIVASWVLLLLLSAGLYGYYWYQNNLLFQQVTQLRQQQAELQVQSQKLTADVASKTQSPAKLAKIDRLKQDVADKQISLQVIEQFDERQLQGYSNVMVGLANVANSDISLTHIQISQQQMNISGMARTPKVVPSWVQTFKNQMGLAGQSFQNLSISRDDADRVVFSLRSTMEKSK